MDDIYLFNLFFPGLRDMQFYQYDMRWVTLLVTLLQNPMFLICLMHS